MTQERIVTRWSGWCLLVVEWGEQSISAAINTGTLYK